MRLAGKRALVTGAGRVRGIGRGTAMALAAEGADVAVHDLDGERQGLEETAARVRELGRRAVVVTGDVSKRPAVDDMVTGAWTALGGLDIFVNNAGVANWESFLEISPGAWQRQVAVNLSGTFGCCQAVARRMVAAGHHGRIIVVSSVHCRMPFPLMAVYGATKHALQALVHSMALELAPHGITTNHIGPGWVDSLINLESPGMQSEADRERTLASLPIQRPAEPYDIGRAAVYLASADADYVNGAFLSVDAGMAIGKFGAHREVRL